ncbi:hypothetical protein UFOVP1304_61 [uncultured Caudovirales phage]|uniref:Uncharacterized protein n=1 Tax=uncultured Caudovirales phage TaxID=2100421 RepID=A0A6J5RSC6_9CAUD|nr:hypothetical protein UFOVP1304_61 [uncultured Caudovirales phage]
MSAFDKALLPLIWRTIDILNQQGSPQIRAIVREITDLLKKREADHVQ